MRVSKCCNSPQGALGRDAHPPGPAVIRSALLEAHERALGATAGNGRAQAKDLELLLGPPRGRTRLLPGRLAHHEASAETEEPGGALGRHRRRAEGPGHDGVHLLPQVRSTGGRLGPRLDHKGSRGEAELLDSVAEEPAPAFSGIEQHDLELGTGGGQDEPGDAAATAEVEAPPGAAQQRSAQGQSMVDVAVDRAGPQETQTLGTLEDISQRSPVIAQTALITTRRRGSSPSETVATPSISFTVSCTILRSRGDMGSKTWSRPDSSAR